MFPPQGLCTSCFLCLEMLFLIMVIWLTHYTLKVAFPDLHQHYITILQLLVPQRTGPTLFTAGDLTPGAKLGT